MTTDTDAAYSTIRYDLDGSCAVITLNREHVMNALNHATIADLDAAFERAREDAAVRGVIVTGSGDRAFVAGADIAEVATIGAAEAERMTRHGQALFDAIETLGKPVIAAINGVALGGGCELAMACTLRIAVPQARFGQPEVKLGLIPGYGGTQRLPRLIGRGPALHLILTGGTIDAQAAFGLGLINEIVTPEELLPRAKAILAEIAANAPLAVRAAIEAVNAASHGAFAEGLALESRLFARCAATDDKREGTAAFLEKRRPHFHGR